MTQSPPSNASDEAKRLVAIAQSAAYNYDAEPLLSYIADLEVRAALPEKEKR